MGDLRKKKSEDPWDTSNMLKFIDGPQKIHLRFGVNMYLGSCRNTAEDISMIMDEDQATWDNPEIFPDQASLSNTGSTGVVRTTIYHCFPTHCTVICYLHGTSIFFVLILSANWSFLPQFKLNFWGMVILYCRGLYIPSGVPQVL